MERIKQAIESANIPRSGRAGGRHAAAEQAVPARPRAPGISLQISWSAVKYVSAALLIFFAGWLWLRLDFMNQIELLTSQFINDGIKSARAEIQRRSAEEEKFKQVLQANLAHCLEAAERDRENYMNLALQQVRVKNHNRMQVKQEKFIIPQAALNEAASMMENAQAECRQVFDAQLQRGR